MEQAKIGPKTALETWRKSKDHPSSPNSPTQSKDVTRPDTAMIPHKKWVVDHTITLIHTPNSRMKVIKPFAITHIGVAQKNRSKISHDISVSYWEIISCNLGVVTMAFGHCLRAHVQEYVSCFWYHMQWWGLTGYDVTSASWIGCIELNWDFPWRLGLFWRGRGINKSHLRCWCMTVNSQSEFLYSSTVLSIIAARRCNCHYFELNNIHLIYPNRH